MKARAILILSLLLTAQNIISQQLHLFSEQMRNAVPPQQVIVLDFIERYFADAKTNNNFAQQMQDDNVFFLEGGIVDLYQLSDTMPFTLKLYDHHMYNAIWYKNDGQYVSLAFPAQYELLVGRNLQQIQTNFKESLTQANLHQRDTIKYSEDMLTENADGIFVTAGEMYELESLTNTLYFIKDKGSFIPVFSDLHLDLSAANLFHDLIDANGYQLYVEQSVYGMKTINYIISLRQWLDYCAEYGLTVYFGVEEWREDGIKAIVIAQSIELGYNHLLTVILPDDFTSNKNAVLKARVTPFIPIHNIKDLFQTQLTKHRKKQWN